MPPKWRGTSRSSHVRLFQKAPASIDPASGPMSMVVFGTSFQDWRPLPAGINHPDKPHHPLVLMTQDVAVEHELARNILVEAHEQAYLAGPHRIIRRPICVRQGHWDIDRVQHPTLDEFVVAFQHAEMQLMNVKIVELVSEVKNGPFLDAVWLNFDH